jgi:hypothetical protein
MRFDGKSTPLIVMLTAGHICFVLISPPGELTSIVCFMVAIGRLCFIAGHMIDPPIHEILLPLRLRLISCS